MAMSLSVYETPKEKRLEETNSQLENRYCVVKGLCDSATAAQVCAYNQEGLINQATLDKWSGSLYLAGVEYDNCANVDPDHGLVGAGFFDEYPGDSTRDACWHSTQKIGDNKFPSLCVEAETEEGARVQCEKDCLQQKANFLEACSNDIACNYIVANLDCDLTGAPGRNMEYHPGVDHIRQ